MQWLSCPCAAGTEDEALWHSWASCMQHGGERQPGWAWIIGQVRGRDGCTLVMLPRVSAIAERVTLIECLCQQLISLVCGTISNAEQFRN